MTTSLNTTLEHRALPADLMARARFWEWERTLQRLLPGVISNRDLTCLFQPIFDLRTGVPLPRGYEALARFPAAPRIPVGLWFRMAHDSGQGVELELAAAHQAIDSLIRLPYGAFLCLNASVDTAAALANELGVDVASRLVIDIPYTIGCHDRRIPALESLRAIGAEISIDDVPLHDLENVCQQMGGLRPSFIKVDVHAGISDSSPRITQLAHGAAWCLEAGISLVAERVESARDLVTLTGIGVEWAQGYSLARPTEL